MVDVETPKPSNDDDDNNNTNETRNKKKSKKVKEEYAHIYNRTNDKISISCYLYTSGDSDGEDEAGSSSEARELSIAPPASKFAAGFFYTCDDIIVSMGDWMLLMLMLGEKRERSNSSGIRPVKKNKQNKERSRSFIC